MKNFSKNPNSLAYRTPRWFIKSARDKFAGKNNNKPDPSYNLEKIKNKITKAPNA